MMKKILNILLFLSFAASMAFGEPNDSQSIASSKELNKMLADKWIIQKVGDTKLTQEENAPYIIFEPAGSSKLTSKKVNKFYASTGCNYINGEYTLTADNHITFHNIVRTENYCTETPYDTEIKLLFGENKTLATEYVKENGEEYLVLRDKGDKLIKIHKPGLGMLNGHWLIAEINDKKVDDETLTLFFDLNELKVHGNTGCNSFNGDIFVDPLNAKVISLSNMGVTMRMCPNQDLQQKLLLALEEASIVKFEKNGKVLLKNSNGKTVLKLQRAPLDATANK